MQILYIYKGDPFFVDIKNFHESLELLVSQKT